MSAALAAWERFWFAPASGARMARVRMLLGAALVIKLTSTYGLVPRLFYGHYRPGFPAHEYTAYQWRGFRVPFVDAFAIHSLHTYRAVEDAALVAALLFLAGAGGRVTGAAVAVLYALLFNTSVLAFSHNELLLLLALTIVGLSPSTDRWSVDALVRRRLSRPARGVRTMMPARMLQVLVSTVYSFTVIAKLNKGWLTGIALHDALLKHVPHFRALRSLAFTLPDSDWVYVPPMWAVLVVETFLAFGFWFPRTRKLALVVGLLFHLGIELTMDVGAYSFAFCALYAAFFAPGAPRTGTPEAGGARPPSTHAELSGPAVDVPD